MLRSVRGKRRLMAATQSSIRVVKTFTYRGDVAKKFSNRYYFDGASPGDDTTWHSLMDAVVLVEKTIYPSTVHIVECFGYDAGSEVAVASKTYTTAGTLSFGTDLFTPGDCAAVLRMATTKRSTKNHTVYVFSYFHQAMMEQTAPDNDTLSDAQKTAIEAYGNDWLTGISVGGRTYHRTTPDAHLTTGRAVDAYIGHRDFPR